MSKAALQETGSYLNVSEMRDVDHDVMKSAIPGGMSMVHENEQLRSYRR